MSMQLPMVSGVTVESPPVLLIEFPVTSYGCTKYIDGSLVY